MFEFVTITEGGRDGGVRYTRGFRSIDGYWSFGGGDVVAIISMGSRDEWQQRHPWALEKRAAILRTVAREVISQRASTCIADIDEQSGDILLRQSSGARERGVSATPGDLTEQARSQSFVNRYARVRSMFGSSVLIVVLVAGGLPWMGKQMLFVAPASGVPLNASIRTDRHIASLIQYTDPHLPRITGRGGDTTSSIGILLIPLDGSAPRVVPVASKLQSNSLALARIVGSDGRTLWFDASGLYGVRLSDYELVRAEELQAANPQLSHRWWEDPRGIDLIDGRLHLVNDDRSQALDIDPLTWQASAATPKFNRARFNELTPADFTAGGFLFGNGSWLGVHSPEELKRDYAPGQRVRAVERAEDAKQPRRLYLGQTEASFDDAHRSILRMEQVSGTDFLNAAFLRLADNGTPLRLSDPDSVLMMYTSAPGLQGTVVVARVDLRGSVLWTTDTGLDRFDLQQILPGADAFAFVGTRPPIPDKLSEPLVVLIDHATGKLTSHTLWR